MGDRSVGVMRHLAVLEEAGLVVTRKQGRYKHHYLNPVPVALIAERWPGKYRERHAASYLSSLKSVLETGTPLPPPPSDS
jgi:DNA-binding transcriptional ArsR family regulator